MLVLKFNYKLTLKRIEKLSVNLDTVQIQTGLDEVCVRHKNRTSFDLPIVI